MTDGDDLRDEDFWPFACVGVTWTDSPGRDAFSTTFMWDIPLEDKDAFIEEMTARFGERHSEGVGPSNSPDVTIFPIGEWMQ